MYRLRPQLNCPPAPTHLFHAPPRPPSETHINALTNICALNKQEGIAGKEMTHQVSSGMKSAGLVWMLLLNCLGGNFTFPPLFGAPCSSGCLSLT